jgi:hypothetical protein
MRNFLLHKNIICILIMLCLSYQAFALEANRGLYYFKFTLPQGSNWTQVVDAPDSTGYTKVFIPAYSSSTYPESIQYAFTIAYFKESKRQVGYLSAVSRIELYAKAIDGKGLCQQIKALSFRQI